MAVILYSWGNGFVIRFLCHTNKATTAPSTIIAAYSYVNSRWFLGKGLHALSLASVQASKFGVIFEFVLVRVKVLFDADLDTFARALIAYFQGDCNLLQL